MATVMDSKKIISNLNDLIELDYDAIAAYKAAIDRLDSADYKANLKEFMGDHKRHIKELSELVRSEGGTAEKDGDAMKILTQGKVILANLAGDNAILKAMKANEEVTNTKYEEAVKKDFSEKILTVLKKGLEDERRHKAWIVTTLEKL